MKRAQPAPMPRYFFSMYGISSYVIASPYGPEVRGVHRVRVVVVRVRVLDLDRAARAGSPGPSSPCRTGARAPADPVVARRAGSGREYSHFRFGSGGSGRKPPKSCGKCPWLMTSGIARLRVRVEALGQQDVRAEVHVAAPELREPLAPDALVLDVLRVRGRLDRRDRLVERERDRSSARVDRSRPSAACCTGCPGRGSTAGPRRGPSGSFTMWPSARVNVSYRWSSACTK